MKIYLRFCFRTLINFIMIFFMTFYFVEPILLEQPFEPSVPVVIFSFIQLLFVGLLSFHYVSWWNAFLDSLPGEALKLSQSLYTQSIGAIITSLVAFVLYLPFARTNGFFDDLTRLYLWSVIACSLFILVIISKFRKISHQILTESETDIKTEPMIDEEAVKAIRLWTPRCLLYVVITTMYLVYASWLFWRPFLRVVPPDAPDSTPVPLIMLLSPFVSLLTPRFILRAYQLKDKYCRKNMGWDRTLQLTMISAVLNILFMAFFPVNSIFHFVEMQEDSAWLGISLFVTAVEIFFVLLYYKKTRKVISWTGLLASSSHQKEIRL